MESTDVTSIPEGIPEPVARWIEQILRDHYNDILAIHNKLLFDNWRIEQDKTTGDYKLMEWNETTKTWDDTGNTVCASS